MNEQLNERYEAEQEIHLRDYLEVIRNRRWVVLSFLFITFTTVLIFSFLKTPVYEASIEILVEQNQASPLMGKMFYNLYDPEFFQTQAEIIKSKNVALKVISLLSLDETYDSYFPEKKDGFSFRKAVITPVKDFLSGFLQGGEEEPGEKPVARSRQDILADTIIANLQVSPVQDSHIITVGFQSTNPEFAALVANTIAEAYKEEMMSIQMNSAGYAIKWMTRKADEVKKKLAGSEHALQKFMKENDIVTVKDKIMIQPQKLADISAKLSKAITERKALEATYNKLKHLLSTGGNLETIPDFAANQNLQAINVEILKSEQQIAQLSQRYGKKHPIMKKAMSDLYSLKARKRQELRTIAALIKNQYDLACMKEENLRKTLEEAKSDVQNLNEKFIQYGILKREVDTSKALYDALVISMKEKGITEESQKVNVWVTNKAQVPETPVRPKKMRNLVLGLVLGLFGGIGAAFLLEYMDNTITDPDMVKRRLGVSTLGIIELLKGDDAKAVYKASLVNTKSAFAEGFRALRSSLLLSSAERPPGRILVTSMNPAEGKTTVASNLAIVITLADHRVLLVDADLRKPKVHKAFGTDNRRGLSSFLAGVDRQAAVQKDEETGVYVLPSGPVPPNPSELLSSDRLKHFLEGAAEKFDYVIVDSPPVLSASDSLVLSRAVAGTIIVGLAGVTTFDALSRGLEQLRGIGSHVLGMVVNGVDARRHRYYYSYYKGYYSYYGDEPGKEQRV